MQILEKRGFEIIERVLTQAECDVLTAQLSKVARSRAGARHLISEPVVAEIASDQRLAEVAKSVLGSYAVPYRATLFDKSIRSNWSVVWHQDTALPLQTRFEAEGWGPWSVKAGVNYAHAPTSALRRILALRVHLDESNASNGPLRVIAESHLLGVLTDERVSEVAHSSLFVECLVPRGGLLAMRPLLIHSSSRVTASTSRRVLHIEYAESLQLEPGVELAAA